MNSSDYDAMVETFNALEAATDNASRRLFDLYKKYGHKTYEGRYQATHNKFPRDGGMIEGFDDASVEISYYVGDWSERVYIPAKFITEDTAEQAFADLEAELKAEREAKRAERKAEKERKAQERERKAEEKEAKERALLKELKEKYEG